jgi:hypothetical protein
LKLKDNQRPFPHQHILQSDPAKLQLIRSIAMMAGETEAVKVGVEDILSMYFPRMLTSFDPL